MVAGSSMVARNLCINKSKSVAGVPKITSRTSKGKVLASRVAKV